ncbi:TraR/DksA family transcriptional regulator [Shouchella clausii]|uniref:TraR/DksA family transcriptional regulator n=1 Tax=Shouchella clausii TaxID=79880 RepID=UPI0015CEB470|nr:TraR/DksA C4-type zinc finger protein [Shouchella clausii]
MGLTEKQLAHLKHQLLEMKDGLETKKRRTTGEMSDSRGDIARGADNHHIGETASEYEDRVIQQSLNEADQKRLQDVKEALERIEEGTYGICIDTGQPIPYERLEALPYAKRTPEAQRERETPLAEDNQEASGVDYVRMEDDTETTRALEQEQQASHQSGEDAFSHSTNEQDWPKQ